ncbi:MAG: ATP-binding cassette domain-containing protein [Alphaproteobacteria bacterium]|jgi:phospholipid/cholesterol/gamma-HCH transport system ATP-binding protein|nr:ATP-binding cassette domain-containing protein [Alphaproteobacteria bacterium]MBT7942056.1 ATP-binding cassette domain-containing protein [Alphaproteobacteria bacterium]
MTTDEHPPVEIRIEGLTKSFDDHTVLRGVDMVIRRGEVVAIVGGSGCGKTVLLNHILGQLEPDAGRVWVADYGKPGAPMADMAALDDLEIDAIHMHCGVVFQRNALFSGSVFENIVLWLREVKNLDDDAIRPIAQQVLTAVALPVDNAFLETDTESLSGGMAKRLAIARALSMNPKIIFFDEPTTGLDPTSAAQVQDLILATHEGQPENESTRTTVIITHDKDLLYRLHPRVVMIFEGQVAFDGPFQDFEASESPITRPYFDLMPVLHQREAG